MLALGILIGLVLGLVSAAHARPAAIVTDIQGRATLLRGSQSLPVTLLTELGDGEVVELAGAARLVFIHYWPGDEYTLQGPGQVRVGYGSIETQAGAPPERRAARSGVRVNPSGLVQARVQMRGLSQPPIRLVHPVGVRLLETPTDFLWHAQEPFAAFNFSLSGDKGALLYEVRTREGRVVLPASVRLAAGGRFAWRVTGNTSGGQERTAIAGFTTATIELADEERRFRPPANAAVSELVAYALWLRQERLQGEAERYWRLVRDLRPGEPALARMIEAADDERNR